LIPPILQRYLAFQLAHMLGAAQASLDLAVAYAQTRSQFARAIGTFQAIKHPLVDASLALENGRYAVQAMRDGEDAPDAAARLVIAASQQAVKLSIQVHGAIGFSWEHDAHLFFKRVYKLSTEARRLPALLRD